MGFKDVHVGEIGGLNDGLVVQLGKSFQFMDVNFPNGNFERGVKAEDRVVRRWLRKFVSGWVDLGGIAAV